MTGAMAMKRLIEVALPIEDVSERRDEVREVHDRSAGLAQRRSTVLREYSPEVT